ncbi:MAG: class I SAM-dependent methyltransferase [Labrys sp. (in: a-proteobacteria)]
MEKTVSLPSGPRGLLVPLDHDLVVQSRPSTCFCRSVQKRFDADHGHMIAFIDTVRPFMNGSGVLSVREERPGNETDPFGNNGYFSGDDARIAYAFVGALPPKRILEIGSGSSTTVFFKAMRDFAAPTTLTSIDHFPRASIRQIATDVIEDAVLNVPLPCFENLEAGDVLFHDGSHLTFNGTDRVHLFLESLQTLRPGVFVHIHDVSFPFDYTDALDGRGYSEQYILAATLLNSPSWHVLAPVCFLQSKGLVSNGGVPFWMQKLYIINQDMKVCNSVPFLSNSSSHVQVLNELH